MPPNWRCRNEPDISDGAKLRAGRVRLPGNAAPQENRRHCPRISSCGAGFYFRVGRGGGESGEGGILGDFGRMVELWVCGWFEGGAEGAVVRLYTDGLLGFLQSTEPPFCFSWIKKSNDATQTLSRGSNKNEKVGKEL